MERTAAYSAGQAESRGGTGCRPGRGGVNLSMPTQALSPGTTPFSVNGRTYRPPAGPLAVVCIDGCADEYLNASLAHGRMPHIARMAVEGYRGLVRGALPSF